VLLYVALKRRVPPQRNTAYLSYRNAAKELGSTNFRKVGEWYRELEFYGFIVLERYGCLGVEGKGKAPQWRLTELGVAATSEQPTRDFLRWDGVLFEPKPRASRLRTLPPSPVPVSGRPVVNLVMSTTRGTPEDRSMSTTRGTPRNGTVVNAEDTSVRNAGDTVFATRGTGFCFPSVHHAGNTWDGDEHDLASRFLAALSVRDASPKD
jgi:hypothetical protein